MSDKCQIKKKSTAFFGSKHFIGEYSIERTTIARKNIECLVFKKNLEKFESLTTNPANFQRFDLFSQIQRILMNLKHYTTKRILKNPDLRILKPYESRFANPDP
jgi:hypothetical protein